jgi:hypothetical protein
MADDHLYPGRKVLGRIEPQPPKGIKYMLGNETWLPAHERDLIQLHCEEWGNLGPLELNRKIKPNKAGFRVRCTTFIAPPGAHGFTEVDGVYYWTDMNWDMTKTARTVAPQQDGQRSDVHPEFSGPQGTDGTAVTAGVPPTEGSQR